MKVLSSSLRPIASNDIPPKNSLTDKETLIWDSITDCFYHFQSGDAKQALSRFLNAESFDNQWVEFRKLQQLASFANKSQFRFAGGIFKIGDITCDANQPRTDIAKSLHENGKYVLASLFESTASHFKIFKEDDLASHLMSEGGEVKIVQVSEGGKSSYVNEMTRLIRSAKETVEISMLTPPEKGSTTYNELVQAFSDLANKTEKIIDIRIVYGRMPTLVDAKLHQTHIQEEIYLGQLIKDIKLQTGKDLVPFNIQFTGFSNSGVSSNNLLSWNHSKIIVIDRKTCNIGGTNLYEGYNHESNPIRDISTTHESPRLASQAANFIYDLATSKDQRSALSVSPITQTTTAMYRQDTNATVLISSTETLNHSIHSVVDFIPAEKFDQLTSNELANVNTMAVLRYGINANQNADIERQNISDVILPTLVRQAQDSLIISQQAIMPMNKVLGMTVGHSQFNDEMILAIKDALKSGVQVTIIKSPSGSVAADGGAYDGLSSDQIKNLLDAVDDPNLVILVPAKRVGRDIVPSPNHGKVIIVDDEAAYVGSHNVYDASHAEYGVISVNKDFVQKMHEEYIVRGFYGNNNRLRLSIDESSGYENQEEPQLNQQRFW